MAITLTDWLEEMERHGLLNRVRDEVHIGAVADMVARNYRQATLFERIDGYDMPLAANTFANRQMIALALGTGEDHVLEALADRIRARFEPVVVETAPCKEVIQIGDEVDLAALPLHLQHELDGAPYISSAVVIARDPRRGVTNMGIYRMMYRTRNETGIDVTAPHKLRHYYQQACEMDQPLEVAAVVGLPAIDILAALASTPYDVDEYGVLGGFRGEAAELVKCETVDLLVPANAEMVLEGEMLPTGWNADEGPYGEFSGTYGASLKRNPVIRIKAVTRRSKAILLSATHGGSHPGWTDMYAFLPMLELDLYDALVRAGLEVKAVRALPAASGMWAAASIRPMTRGDSRTALTLMLSASRQAFPKFAVVVDDDIDIFDDDRLTWAMTWRSQPDADAIILEDMKAVPLDPSLPPGDGPVTTSKLGLDATIPFGRNRADFAVCHPAIFDGAPSAEPPLPPDEMDAEMLAFIAAGPVHFRDIIARFGGRTWHAALAAFGRLRAADAIGRDEEGRYVANGDG